ncbi:FG-GAP repeat protein, partial [bacterium]|nr:FG-GAP repeat protein [candidate division CSSED10-310 bacterium]
QGFTLFDRPAGRGSLTIRIGLEGLTARLNQDGQVIELVTTEGKPVFNYGSLIVKDAAGAGMAARLEVTDAGAIQVVVDDGRAEYPLFIDPVITETLLTEVWTYEGYDFREHLGHSVAAAGDVNNDGYEDIIIGAPDHNGCGDNSGRVLVFYGSASGPGASPNWENWGASTGFRYGYSVAAAGDVNNDGYADIIIGAPFHQACGCGGSEFGRAVVYHGSAGGLLGPAWSTSLSSQQAAYGCAVASAGDVNNDGYDDVIVGAYMYGNDNAGQAWLYHGSASGLSNMAAWTAGGYDVQDTYGTAVASAGDVNNDGYDDVIVGAPYYQACGCGGSEFGRAYVYHGSPAGVSTSYAWAASGDYEWCMFGVAVAGAGDVDNDGYDDVVIGAKQYGNGGYGKVYLFRGSPSGLESTPFWTKEATQYGEFGSSVAPGANLNNDQYSDIVIGMKAYDFNFGAVFVFEGSATGPAADPDWAAYGTGISELGWSVGAGDVNGDGLDDIIVGSPLFTQDCGQASAGRAILYQLDPGTPYPTPTASITPEPSPSQTPEPTPSQTPEPTPSMSPEPSPSQSPEPTMTPSPVPTDSPTPAYTCTPTIPPTPAPVPALGGGGAVVLILLFGAAMTGLGVTRRKR